MTIVNMEKRLRRRQNLDRYFSKQSLRSHRSESALKRGDCKPAETLIQR